MKNKEIEVKLNYQNKKELISRLGNKIIFIKKVFTKDKYYSQKHNDMSNAHDLVRIRQINHKKAELTYKGSTEDKNKIWQRIELTIDISSADTMHQIITNLKFKVISENECERDYWKIDDLEIVFVKFTKPALLEFMEIEGNSHEKIDRLILTLGDQVRRIGEEIFHRFDKK